MKQRIEADRADALRASIAAADRLGPLVEDAVVQRFFEARERALVDQAISAATDAERLSALAEAKALRSLKAALAAVIATGPQAETRLAQIMEKRS